MCDCIVKVNDSLLKVNCNTQLDIPFMLSRHENSVMCDRVSISVCKIDSKNRKKAKLILASYCPFCGSKYD